MIAPRLCRGYETKQDQAVEMKGPVCRKGAHDNSISAYWCKTKLELIK